MIPRRPLLSLLATALLLAPALLLPRPAAGQQDPPREVTRTEETLNAWLKAALPPTRDLERLKPLLDPEVLFIDPTAEVYGVEQSKGVRGRDEVLRLLASSDLRGGRFEVQERFIAGEYAVVFGNLELIQPAWTGKSDAPLVSTTSTFSTVLRIREGKIVEWIDRGDHVGRIRAMAKHVPGLEKGISAEQQEQLEETARAYLAAYAGLDPKGMICCYGDSPRFWDPTAALFGMGDALVGVDVIRATLSMAFAPVIEMSIEPTRSFFSHHTAVFLSRVEWTTVGSALGLKRESASFSMLMMTVLRIEGGKVLEHIDYCDYEPALEKVEKLQTEDGIKPRQKCSGGGLSAILE